MTDTSKNIDDEFKELGKNAQKAILLHEVIFAIIVIGVATGVKYGINAFEIPEKFSNLVFWIYCFVVAFTLGDLVFDSTIGYRHRRYKVNSESVEYVCGIFSVKKTIVPVRRMQQVEITEGPITKMFKLANIKIITAGGTLDIRYLDVEFAKNLLEDLKKMINEFAKEEKNHVKGA